MRRRLNTQTLLSVTAIALALVAIARSGGPALDGATPAGAGDEATPFNATEQRAQMIAQQRETNARLARVEQALKSGVSVRAADAAAAPTGR